MFIVIKKITTQYEKDNENRIIRNPVSDKPKVKGMKVVEETIRIDDIKSSREYHDPKLYKDNGIDGPVTVIYFAGNKGVSKKLPEIHINESIDSWNKRIGAVAINVKP